MKNGFRQSMGWLHTWSGLLLGWVLFFVFLTGTAGYFEDEIGVWMQPERALRSAQVSTEAAIATGTVFLRENASDAVGWLVMPPTERSPDLSVFWELPSDADDAGRRFDGAIVDAETGGALVYRETGGGRLLYRMHWRLHYMPVRVAEIIVGISAMFMLVGILTGVIVHKRIFRDFFTLRLGKGQRTWLDAHNVLGVMTLPFLLMITFSGLVFRDYLYMAPVVAATYGTGPDALDTHYDELFGRIAETDRVGTAVPLVSLGPLLAIAHDRFAGGEVRFLEIHNPGDAGARIVITGGRLSPTRERTELTFDGTTGDLLHATPDRSLPLLGREALLGLHEGLFAGPLLRWLYFLSGLAGTALIGAGLLLWSAKRRRKTGDGFGFRLVERLNVGTLVGLPVAVAAYFWANRLLPAGLEGRAAWEANVMFVVWAAMLLHAFVRPSGRSWVEQLWIAAAAFGLLPLLNALTTDKHLGVTLPAEVWELAGFDLSALVFGAAFAAVAWQVRRGQRREHDADRRALAPVRADAAGR